MCSLPFSKILHGQNGFFLVALSLAVLVFSPSCGNLKEKGYDTKAIAEEVKNRKIKRITQAQLDEAANEWGSGIVRTAQQDLIQTLKAALAKYPLEEAAAYCNVARLSKADSIRAIYQAALHRRSLRALKGSAALPPKEREVLDAYLYNAEQKLPQTTNVQRVEGRQLLFTAPIVLDNALCLRCHGQPGTDVSPSDLQKLRSRYALDSLTNHRLQDFLGMWSVNFEKKELVKKIDVK